MPRQAIYSKPVTSLRKTQLMNLALDLDLSSDGTVSNLRSRINTHLNNNRNTLSRNPRFRHLFPKRRRQSRTPEPSENSQHDSNSRSGTPTLSDSSTWHGIQAPEGRHPSPTPILVENQGMYSLCSSLTLFFRFTAILHHPLSIVIRDISKFTLELHIHIWVFCWFFLIIRCDGKNFTTRDYVLAHGHLRSVWSYHPMRWKEFYYLELCSRSRMSTIINVLPRFILFYLFIF